MTFLLLDAFGRANPKIEREKKMFGGGREGRWEGGKSVHSIFIDVRVDVRNKYIVAASEPIYFICFAFIRSQNQIF